MRPVAALLSGDRLHLQHGPIDLVIGIDGDRDAAFAAARARLETVLSELVAELPLLRTPVLPGTPLARGVIERRMDKACRPCAHHFVTRMAAVAGSVADEVLEAILHATTPERLYVNNGGDISVFLT